MVTLNLDKIFNPKSIAIIGASDEEDSVGYAIVKNFTSLATLAKSTLLTYANPKSSE